jgi:predicted nucleic acid-binding protein
MKAVIDSDVLIDYLQGISPAKKELERYSDPCFSVISWMEVMCGAETEEERSAAKSLLSSMRMVVLSGEIAEKAVEARKTLRLKLPDAVIWATADAEACILVTRNTRDFDKKDPRIRFPYSV